MKRFRLTALLLALVVLLSASAQALTAEQAKELLRTYYIDDLPAAVEEADTVEGVLAALGDPYTAYLTAEEYEEFLSQMRDGEGVGIGVQCDWTEGAGILILRVFSDGAAAEKLLPGDVIVNIDGTVLAGLNLESALLLLRGEVGSEVTIQAKRGEVALPAMTLTRSTFTVPATEFELIDGHIGYIYCAAFGPETSAHFNEAMEELDNATNCWIVDLRGNSGGEMQAASEAMGVFTGARDTAYLRDHSGEYYRYGAFPDYTTIAPVIVLVDEGTASASEMFAGGIQATMSGIVIGTRTFGKGIAQTMLDGESDPDYFPDGDAMKITCYRNFFPNGNTSDVIGVVPTLLISPENTEAVALLLSASSPEDNTDMLRLHVGNWRFYLDLNQATSEAFYPAFVELLEALPYEAGILYLGQGDDVWDEVSVWEVAALCAPDFVGRGFDDAMNSPWADEINTLAGLGILRGNEAHAFMPKAELTRAELCALLAQAIGYTGQPDGAFSDVAEDAWYAAPVAAIRRQGLVQGYDGAFFPDEPVTHEQFLIIMTRLSQRLNLYAYNMREEPIPTEAAESGDYDRYSDWARDLVWLGDGLFYDDAVNIDPFAPTTREEAAAGVYAMLSRLGYI